MDSIELENVFQKRIGRLYILVNKGEILEAQDLIKDKLIFLFLIGVSLALLIATVISMTIAKPIHVFKNYIESMAGQDFGIKIDEDLLERRDEIGYFAKSFENLKENFLLNQQPFCDIQQFHQSYRRIFLHFLNFVPNYPAVQM